MTNEELAALAQAGDAAVLTELWKNTRRLCWKIAGKYLALAERAGMEREDLKQECYFGFLGALRAFDPASGNKFTSYLNYPVWNACADALGIRGGRRMKPRAVSLQSPLDDEDGGELQDLVEDKAATKPLEDVEDQAFCDQLRETLEKLLDGIDARQALTLRARYFEGKGQKETAAALGCAPSRVGQLEGKGLCALRHPRRVRQLRQFREEIITTHAARSVGFSAWKGGGSVEERIVERLEEKGL